MKIKIDNFAKEIEDTLSYFSDDVISIVKKDVEDVAEESLKILVENAPVKDGKYKKSLSKTKSFESATDVRYTLHSKNKERSKTHLLENGHATRNGGRTKAIPHFSKANDFVEHNLLERVEKDIKNMKK